MKKSEVCVRLTRKNCKKVLGILEMFGEKVYSETRLSLKNGLHLNEGYPFVYFNGLHWVGAQVEDSKAPIKTRQLRNILAREHLKPGDVCAFKTGHGKEVDIRVLSKIDDSDLPFVCTQKGVTEAYAYFLRYATDEEKALLEPKKVQVTEWSPQVDKGFISQAEQDGFKLHQTYTHEVWVNHYSDQEFHIHYNKEIAELHSRINNGFGRDVQTVKATLTYDIPMTKV